MGEVTSQCPFMELTRSRIVGCRNSAFYLTGLYFFRNYFPKLTSGGAPLHTLSKLYDVPVGFVFLPLLRQCIARFCGRRRVAVARYRMICLVLLCFFKFI